MKPTLLAVAALVLALAPACKSPGDVGFDAGAKYMSIFAAVGADTQTMPCPERLALAKEFFDKGKEGRAELAAKVADTRDDPAFTEGLNRITSDVRPKVVAAFAQACPAEAPQLVELMSSAEEELGIAGLLPPLSVGAQ